MITMIIVIIVVMMMIVILIVNTVMIYTTMNHITNHLTKNTSNDSNDWGPHKPTPPPQIIFKSI